MHYLFVEHKHTNLRVPVPLHVSAVQSVTFTSWMQKPGGGGGGEPGGGKNPPRHVVWARVTPWGRALGATQRLFTTFLRVGLFRLLGGGGGGQLSL